jgi:phytoene synthase
LLRNLAAHARAGRCLLPEDALARHGLSAHEVLATPGCARPVVLDLLVEGRRWGGEGRGRYKSSLLAGALVGVLARRDLRRIANGREPARGLSDRLAVMLGAATGVLRG